MYCRSLALIFCFRNIIDSKWSVGHPVLSFHLELYVCLHTSFREVQYETDYCHCSKSSRVISLGPIALVSVMFSGTITPPLVSGTSITYDTTSIPTIHIRQTATPLFTNITSNDPEIGKPVIPLKAICLLIATLGTQLLHLM